MPHRPSPTPRRLPWLPAAAAVAALSSACGSGPDRIVFRNAASGLPIGVLVDGRLRTGDVNDQTFLTNDTLEPGEIDAGRHNEVVAFQQERPVTVVDARWSKDGDQVTVDFPGEIVIRVHVWLLAPPAEERRAQALAAIARTNEIWRDERMGVRIQDASVTDRSGDAASRRFLTFNCGGLAELRTQVGYESSTVNLYFVDRVDFGSGPSTGNGISCTPDILALGRNASGPLATHELGHNFGLGHVNSFTADFDETNVMHSASDTRAYLTEGQVFRSHLGTNSALNLVYDVRSGRPRRSCGILTLEATDECPALQKRIWADGTFPPN